MASKSELFLSAAVAEQNLIFLVLTDRTVKCCKYLIICCFFSWNPCGHLLMWSTSCCAGFFSPLSIKLFRFSEKMRKSVPHSMWPSRGDKLFRIEEGLFKEADALTMHSLPRFCPCFCLIFRKVLSPFVFSAPSPFCPSPFTFCCPKTAWPPVTSKPSLDKLSPAGILAHNGACRYNYRSLKP